MALINKWVEFVNGIDPENWGVATGYHAYDGRYHVAPAETIEAVLESMGASSPSPPGDGPIVVGMGEVRSGGHVVSGDDYRIRCEDGSDLDGCKTLPADVPLGYHKLIRESDERTLIVAPDRCAEVADARSWGWAVQLYAARSRDSWGVGDLGDLARLGAVMARHGADVMLINPLHAPVVGQPQEASPYFPSSRSFRNPIYLDIERVPGVSELGEEMLEWSRRGRQLNQNRRIDRDEVWKIKSNVLDAIWRITPRSGLQHWIARQPRELLDYATFCAIVESHGRKWNSWPDGLRTRDAASIARFRKEKLDRIEFHAWLQMMLQSQLGTAAGEISVMHDLAIGVDPHGADAWMWQDAMCLDMHVGAPPDEFNTRGQNWSLPPFHPWKLRALDYAPFISTLRANMALGAAIRIDHVMGLFRLFWVPEGASAQAGTYVRYPSDDLLAILALESHRAGTYVVGEDLGTVEQTVREQLAAAGVLSYKLMWFEESNPRDYPVQSMAAVTTHDLPTVLGASSGSDLVLQQEMGLHPNVESMNNLADRVRGWAGKPDAEPSEIIESVHAELAHARSVVVTATLEDALGCTERPNYPGTTDEYPNWSVALPVDVDDLADHDGFGNLSKTLSSQRTT